MADTSIAVILGLVEGITEFLPVSSTGHLILAGHALGFEGEAAETFQIFIQLGAILAIVALYPYRFFRLFDWKERAIREDSFRGVSGIAKLFLLSLPALVMGALFHSRIKEQLFHPWPVALALTVGGLAMILLDRPNRAAQTSSLDDVSFRQCVFIGAFQCFALWPGMSRSGSTIIGGLLAGLTRTAAAELSFLAAVPVMAAATIYDLLKSLHVLGESDIFFFAVGFVVSFLSALVAVKFFVKLLQKTTLRPFGAYRIVLGPLVLWFWN